MIELISVRWLDEAGSTEGAFVSDVRSPLPRREEVMEAALYVAGVDVHKRMLAVVVANARDSELEFEFRRLGTTVGELPISPDGCGNEPYIHHGGRATCPAFPSAAQLASWVGGCPGRQESAGEIQH
jgi:hypothetical protein